MLATARDCELGVPMRVCRLSLEALNRGARPSRSVRDDDAAERARGCGDGPRSGGGPSGYSRLGSPSIFGPQRVKHRPIMARLGTNARDFLSALRDASMTALTLDERLPA